MTIQELAQFPFLMREPGVPEKGAGRVSRAAPALGAARLGERRTQALIKAVVEGLAWRYCQELLIQQDVASGNVVPLTLKEPLRRTLNIVYHKRKYLSESMQRFIALCRETGEQ